jgi:hypothetical protein
MTNRSNTRTTEKLFLRFISDFQKFWLLSIIITISWNYTMATILVFLPRGLTIIPA